MGRVDGKIAIITGAGDGLGRTMARLFAAEGARLVIAGRREEKLAETAAQLADEPLVVPTDITLEGDVVELVRGAVTRYGRVDIMLNNAAQPGQDRYLWEQTLQNWNDTIAVDTTGAMLCTREVLRQSMLEQRSGAIVNVSSTAGWRGIPRKSHYCVAKAGLRTLTKVAAQEAGPYGIRVNCLVPGSIDTALLDGYFARIAGERGIPPEQMRDEVTSLAALRRISTAEEIAAAALFLASDEAPTLTGQSLNVDAGGVLVG